MSDSPGPRRRSTHVSTDVSAVPEDAVEEFDESTVIARRRSVPESAMPEPVVPEDVAEEFDESTVIAKRRSVPEPVSPEPVVPEDAVEEFDESTVIAKRRSEPTEPTEPTEPIEPTAPAAPAVADEFDESTVISARRTEASDATEVSASSARRSARRAAQQAEEELEPTDPGQRHIDETAVSKRKTGLEATIKSLRKPKINPPAKIETLTLASRRTTKILDDGGQPVSRAAFTPQEAILKAPYKPRKQTVIPVVHLDRQLDTRPAKPFAESMTALARQRRDARRRVVVMALVGGGTMVVSAAGIIALLMLG